MLREVLRSLFRKPATNLYPFEKLPLPEKFRGKLVFIPAKCVGCRMCARDCPSGALEISKAGEKQFEACLDLSRCIYCCQCVDSCPRKALDFSGEIELAQFDKSKLKVVFRGDQSGKDPEKTA